MYYHPRRPRALWIRYSPFYLLFWYIIYHVVKETYHWALFNWVSQ